MPCVFIILFSNKCDVGNHNLDRSPGFSLTWKTLEFVNVDDSWNFMLDLEFLA